MVLLSVIGIALLIFVENILPIDLKANEKVSDSIYFLTGVILLWYTKETYDLKKNAFNNNWGLLKVDEDNTFKNTNFACTDESILRKNDEYKSINFRIFLKNAGQGSLQIIKVENGSTSYVTQVGNQDKIEIKITPRGFDTWSGKELNVMDTLELDYEVEITRKYSGIINFDLDVTYKDILGEYKHKFCFTEVSLDKPSFKIFDKGKLKIQ